MVGRESREVDDRTPVVDENVPFVYLAVAKSVPVEFDDRPDLSFPTPTRPGNTRRGRERCRLEGPSC